MLHRNVTATFLQRSVLYGYWNFCHFNILFGMFLPGCLYDYVTPFTIESSAIHIRDKIIFWPITVDNSINNRLRLLLLKYSLLFGPSVLQMEPVVVGHPFSICSSFLQSSEVIVKLMSIREICGYRQAYGYSVVREVVSLGIPAVGIRDDRSRVHVVMLRARRRMWFRVDECVRYLFKEVISLYHCFLCPAEYVISICVARSINLFQ